MKTAASVALVAEAPAPASPWAVFSVASVAVFLVSIDTTVLFAAFGALRAGFPGSSSADLSWVLNAYTVVYAALLVPAGRLADQHGRKRIFQWGLGLFLLASWACGWAPTVEWLIAARVLQAAGAALLTPSSLALVLGAFPAHKRAIAVSLWGAVGGLAAALGPSVGAGVVDALGWRWAFYLNLPIGAWALWRGRTRLVESRNPDNAAPLDLPGIGLLIIGVGALALGIVRSEALGWRSGAVLGSLAAGVIALLAFVAWARRARHPAIDLSLFHSPTYRFVNLATLSFGIAFAMMFFGFFFFMMQVWHYPLPLAGLAVTPGPLLVVPVAIVAGRFAARIGHRPLLVGGSLLYAAAGLWFFLRAGTTPDYLGTWLPGLIMTGSAVGMVLPSLGGAAVAGLPPQRFGVGSAVNQAIRQIGSVLGVAATVALVGHAAPSLADFRWLYGAHVALALLTAALCLRVDTRPAAPR
ncbi:MFS transporter [Aquincola sp. S2]|uniref:MFS transporter n=1 Tax=Pseudaquabacterium terrae TaxID=2732868 RepID=A0ABX2EFK2_9BURK|nr:MFS transporter [Aquabacterium terrae]NRF67400.1 MFS transporter [Aquabacterium terrae]